MTTRRQFAAFISYRHVDPDRTWAQWLHRALESYRVPPGLVAKGYPKRVGVVFRDEEELAASHDLSEEIEAALEASAHLIVVCSPQTPGSEWVNAEIARFKEMGREDDVLALLIEGEPAQSFPAALLPEATDADRPLPRSHELEPLAADVRPLDDESLRSRRRTALLRIAATILGCRYDDLRRREAQRRARRRRLVAGAGLLLIGLLTGLVVWALRERTRAEQAAARAEYLLGRSTEFVPRLMKDIRDDVATLRGSTRAQRRLSETVTAYLDALALREGDDADLRIASADAYQTLAHIHGGSDDANPADRREAISQFEKAIRLYDQLVAEAPDDRRRRFAAASSRLGLGNLYRGMGDVPKARALERVARATMEELYSAAPSDHDVCLGTYTARTQVAQSDTYAGDHESALTHYLSALKILEDDTAHFGDTTDGLEWMIQAHANVGRALQTLGRDKEAEHHFAETSRLSRLAEKRPDVDRGSLWRAHDAVGSAHLAATRWALALPELQRALEIADAAVADDPLDGRAFVRQISSRLSVASALERLGRFEEALPVLEAALKSCILITDADPTDRTAQWDLRIAHTRVGSVQGRLGNLDAAKKHLEAARAIAESRVKSMGTPEERSALAEVYVTLSTIPAASIDEQTSWEESMRRWRESRDWCQRAVDIYRALDKEGLLLARWRRNMESFAGLLQTMNETIGKLEKLRPQ